MELFSQIIGWVGTILVVLAYFLLSKSEKVSKLYQAMNLLGAICLGVNVYYQHAWPAFGLQIVWGIIAVSSLLKIKRRR